MAIEYFAYLDTQDSPSTLADLLTEATHRVFGQPTVSLDDHGLAVHVAETAEPGRTFTREDYGVDARCRLVFRLDKRNLQRAESALAKVVGEFLSLVDGDAVVLFNGDLVVLRRTGANHVLRRGFHLWQPDAPGSLAQYTWADDP